MQILPAIDIRGGRCVRLRQGDYQQQTVFGDDPAAMAERWGEQGAKFLHLVDLDGAKEGRPVNGESVCAIVKSSGVPCQLGGGIRTDRDVDTVLGWGVQRVVIGTRALQAPDWIDSLCRRYPGSIVVGIDARDGQVATDGWLKVSRVSALELANRFAALPVSAVVYTDIARDGMLAGPNLTAMREMAMACRWPVIASGGVTEADDIARLAETGVAGCIIGRALYEGRIDLRDVINRFSR